MEMASVFTLNVRLDNIAIITIDVPGEKNEYPEGGVCPQVRAIIKQPVKTKSCEAWCLSPLNRTTSLLAQTST